MNRVNPQSNLTQATDCPPASDDLNAWLAYLESLHPSNIEMGLERITQVYQRMALPKLAPCVITVAGTNGKGSTCAYIEHCLSAAGYKVGVYSSPHLIRFNERIRLAGTEPDDPALIAALQHVEAVRGTTQLTFFEFTTLAAFYLFAQTALDVVVLEVGLGGRLDATNIITPDVAVVTTVAQDHEAFLGNDIEQIGREKAGIFRPDTPAILGDSQLPQTVAAYARQIGAKLVAVDKDFSLQQAEQGVSYRSEAQHWDRLQPQHLPIENLATALAAIEQTGLAVTPQAIRNGVATAALPGRWQALPGMPQVRLDVAHNPQATAWLAKQIRQSPHRGKTVALVGMLADKDSMNALANMRPVVDEWHVVGLAPPRGADAGMLLPHLPQGAVSYTDVAQAYRNIKPQLQADDLLIVFGSFLTVAAILRA